MKREFLSYLENFPIENIFAGDLMLYVGIMDFRYGQEGPGIIMGMLAVSMFYLGHKKSLERLSNNKKSDLETLTLK